MIIVQITDTHIEEPGSLAYERFDTAANLRGGCGDQPDKAGTRDGLAYRRYGASRLDRAIPLFQGTDRGLRGALLRHTRKPRRSRTLPGGLFRYGLDAERRHVPALYDRRLPVRIVCCDPSAWTR